MLVTEYTVNMFSLQEPCYRVCVFVCVCVCARMCVSVEIIYIGIDRVHA